MNKEKTDMLIYTTEDGLTKVETTFDGDFKELLLRNLAIKQMDTLDRINLSAVSGTSWRCYVNERKIKVYLYTSISITMWINGYSVDI